MARKMVVALSSIFFRGGIPRFNQMLCLALDELSPVLDLEVTVLSQDDGEEEYKAWGSPWRNINFIPGRGQLGLTLRTLGVCVRQRPDLLLIGLMGMTPLGVLCRPFVRDGFGFIAHGNECWDDHPLSDRRKSRRFTASRASYAISVSNFTSQELSRMAGIPQDSIYLLPNTLDPGFENMKDLPVVGSADRAPQLLTVSRLWDVERMKGVDHSIQVFARLAERFPQMTYRIVGKGNDKPRLIELAKSLGVEERVIFQEDLTDAELADCYRKCTLFLLPSGQEGFGIVFLEAMRFSKACIGGRAGGTPEVIDDERTGYLVPYSDLDAIETALTNLVSNPEQCDEMGRNGRQRLEQEFSFKRYTQYLEGHLRRLLG